MQGLTAKVFRTYNASITLQEQLAEMTDETDNIPAKVGINNNLYVILSQVDLNLIRSSQVRLSQSLSSVH